jgi:hypothetical protein
MKNKIVVILLCMLLIATTLSFTGCIGRNEQLDQISGEDNPFFEFLIMQNYDVAQSFIPTLNTLTRVEVKIQKEGDPGYINLSIRKNLYDVDLTSSLKHSGMFPPGTDWLDFDFDDIKVTPGETYYIVISSEGGVFQDQYFWRGANTNPYSDGNGWFFNILSGAWEERADVDFCFKTYGFNGLSQTQERTYHLMKILENYPILYQFFQQLINL